MQKRLMFVAILLLAICNRIVAEDQITIGDFSLYSGDTKAVSVMLTNEDSYVGFQFDLYLPDGISVESFSANSSRIPEGTTPQMSQQSDGSYRFVAAALERNPIVGNEGAILTLTIKAADSIVAKDYTGYLRNIKISKTDGTGVTKAEQTFTITVKGAEAYAVLTGDTISGMTLTFYYDTKKEQRGGMNVGPFSDYSDYEANSGWYAQCGSITSAVFDPSFANCTTITSTAWWFDYCTKLTSITGLNYLNTANVTDMKAMFRYCMNLTNLDVSGFKTDNVTDMSGMFSRCQSLTNLDVSGFKTDKVTDMSYMFEECLNLTNLDVSGFKTDNVTNMGWMFDKCHSLTSLDVTGFNTQNVTDMSNMFHNCFGLTSLDLSNFNTQNVTNMHYMFRCTNLTSLDVSHFNTQNVTDMSDMFIDCRSLTSLDVTNFNTKNVTGMSNMFSGCSSLTSLDLSNFNTQNVAGMSNMFQNCSSLTTIYAGSEWSTTAVTKSTDMFNGCTNLVGGQGTAYDSLHVDVTYAHIDGGPSNPGYFTDIADLGKEKEAYAVLSADNTTLTFYYDLNKENRGGMSVGPFGSAGSRGWNGNASSITSVVFDSSFANDTTLTSTARWFYGLQNLTAISGIENLKTDNVTDMTEMFAYCNNLTNLDVRHFNTISVKDMSSLFSGCSSLTSLDISGFKTDNVTDMSYMFDRCSSLTSLDVSGFKTDNVTNMSWMFHNCSGLTNLDVSGFNTQNVKDMSCMFLLCSGLTSLDVSGFKTENVTHMTGMFHGCSSLTSLDVSNFNTAKVTNISRMFNDCNSLTSLDLNHFNTDNVTDMQYMFCGSGFTSLDLSSFNTSNVTNMGSMFGLCPLKTIYVSSLWTTSNVTESSSMFQGCYDLVGGMGTTYGDKHTDYTYAHIDGGPSNPGYFTDIADLGKVNEAYAVLTGDTISGMTLTFYYDKRKEERNGMSVGPFAYSDGRGWNTVCSSITKVVFNSSMAEYTSLESTANWFDNCTNLSTIQGIENLKTDSVTDMHFMFSDCAALASINVSGFDMSNVTSTRMMFQGCRALENINLTGWNTQSLTDIYGMFMDCSDLRSVDLSVLNTSSVTNMRDVFAGCDSLTTVNLRGFNTSNVTTMWGMFRNSAVTSLDLSSFNTVKVTDMANMFLNCNALNTIYVGGNWTTSAVTSSENMFGTCYNLVGGSGTVYNYSYTDASYAHIDGGSSNPGYFTDIADLGKVNEPYAVLTGDTITGMTLTFYYDKRKEERNGMDVGPFRGSYDESLNIIVPNSGWFDQRESITTVVFDPSFADCTTLTSTAFWFHYMTQLRTIEGIRYLKTDNVTDMGYMFCHCSSLTALDVSGFKTDNVKDVHSMFSNCTSLASLDVSGFKTDNVEDMDGTFGYCSSLTSLDLSNFNTSNVKSMLCTFEGCSGLTSLDLSNFNTEKVEWMTQLFFKCSNLTTLDLSGFKTENVKVMSLMFERCPALKTIYVGEGWSTAKVDANSEMFQGCTSLVGGMGTTYDANHIDATYAHIDGGPDNPGYLTDIADLGKEREPYAALSSDGLVVTFYYDRKKEDRGGVDINNRFLNTHEATDVSPYGSATTAVFDASFADYKPTSTAYWFCKCSSLKTIRGIENLNTVDVTDMSSMFYSCDSLTSIDVSGFNTENVTNMNSMFGLCYSLARLDVSNFKTENVTNMGVMFSNCHELTSLDLSNFKTDNVTDMSHMFSGSWNLTSVNLSGFNTKNVKDMSFMFYGCFDLQSLDISHFNTANVTNMRTMFYGCSFSSLDLSGFNTAKVTEMSAMFSSCRSLKTIFAGDGWSTAKVEDGIDMFMECTSLVGGMGTAYDSLHIDYTYAHIDGGPDNPGYFTRSGDAPYVEPEPYAVLEENTNANGMVDAAPNRAATAKMYTLKFYYDGKKTERNGMDVKPFSIPGDRAWEPNAASVTAVVFDDSFANDTTLTSTAFWFYGFQSLTSITGISNVKTNNVTDMQYMFHDCNVLTSVDVTGFNTSNVTNMQGLFYKCHKLKTINVNSFNTAKVTNMSWMFFGCYDVTSIFAGSYWTTSAVTESEDMFMNCSKLVGGMGTVYDENHVDHTYACIDGGTAAPGYLTDINSGVAIYVQASEAPYLYAFDADGNALNGEFPGNQMTETETVNGQTFWKTRIYRPVPFNINILDKDLYRTREIYVISDRYFVYEGQSKYTDVTARYIDVPEIQISSLALPGSHNGWDRAQLFTETESGRNYTMEVDLTDVTIEDNLFQFKLFANACAWLGITSLTLDAPSYVHSMGNPELIASDRNIFLDLNSAPTRKFLFEAKWNGGTQMEEGWTLRISEVAVPHYTFDSTNGVLTISGGTTVAEALEAAGGSSAASALTSIIWQNTTPLTNDDLQGLDNPNMLIYVADASLAPANRDNVIIGNDSTGYTAMNIVLADVADGNGDFYCPIAFTADMISYTHEYRQQTEVGVARGWETIAMPFTVQTITHEKNGVISPFGNDASTKHFWLRQLTQQGLAQARQIEANTPYLISMPNSDAYPVEFNQAGRVTFSSQNATVPVTQLNVMEAPTATGGMVMIQPNFKGQSATSMIYALNVGVPRGDHPEGSVFEANYRSVRPFEAFTVHHGDGPAPQFISIVDINNGGTTGIEDVRSLMSDGRGDNWYDLNGRRLQQKPTRKGVYILNGQKVVIK